MNYLALGDSYTIGEGLAIWDSFPYIFVQKVRKSNKEMNGAEIVAKTGYTSKELLEVVRKYKFNNIKYDLVSVLIGVNNIYRKLEIEEFKKEFKELLEVAQKLGK